MNRCKDFPEKLSTLPSMPGVYLMKNTDGKIIYVGKSKCLKNRVSSYFHSTNLNIKTQGLVENIYDFEIIVTQSEKEALVLENELIKRHNPKYNIKLKDAKTYPYIKLEVKNGYPAVNLARRRTDSKAKYFGPYTSSVVAGDIISSVRKIFKIPDCNKSFCYNKQLCRPCLNYHLDNCLAPCTGKISENDYTEIIKETEAFLKGNCKDVIAVLQEKMYKFSDEMRFEEAAKCRDKIKNLQKLSEKQAVVMNHKNEEDVFGIFETEVLSCVTVLKVREGVISDKDTVFFSPDEISDDEALSDLILRYYDNYDTIPRSILTSFALNEAEINELSETLSELACHTVNVHHPERGDKKALCKIAENNSSEAIVTRMAIMSNNEKLLISLAQLLQLEVLPARIESYDISNSGTSSMYAGMIVLNDGKLSKKDYRSFSIKSTDGIDDYGAMAEALTRRLKHIDANDDDSMNVTPDLILLDGGKGHVNTVKEIIKSLNLYIPVFGMVKDEHHKTRTLTDGENEISIALDREMFNFFYKIQEEVHRYTFGKMDSSRRKTVKGSILAEIEGIGEAKASILLKHFKTVTAIKNASVDELCEVSGISKQIAENIYRYFHTDKEK